MAVKAAIEDLEALLDVLIEQQRVASQRHDKALEELRDALDQLALVYGLTLEEGDDDAPGGTTSTTADS